MARAIYPKFKNRLLTPGTNLLTASLRAYLVSTTSGTSGNNFPYNAAHEFASSIPAGAILAGPITLGGVAITNAALSCNDIVFPSVAAVGSATGQAIIIVEWITSAAASPLVAFIDDYTGMPVTLNGEDITIDFTGALLTIP
jgi:hypothetical protein